MGWKLSVLTLLLLPLGLIPALPPFDGAGGVHDDAKFFSSDAVAQSEKTIRGIWEKEHRAVLIETISDLSPEQQDDLQKKGKIRFWEELTDGRAQASGISGVYILICKHPGHLEAAVGNQTAERLFTRADRDELVRRMLNQFRQKQFDAALVNGLDFIHQQMNAHTGER